MLYLNSRLLILDEPTSVLSPLEAEEVLGLLHQVGVAGVAGNGQRELVEVLAGQRRATAGRIEVNGKPFRPTRSEMLRHRYHVLPEEPLRNGHVGRPDRLRDYRRFRRHRHLGPAHGESLTNVEPPDVLRTSCEQLCCVNNRGGIPSSSSSGAAGQYK